MSAGGEGRGALSEQQITAASVIPRRGRRGGGSEVAACWHFQSWMCSPAPQNKWAPQAWPVLLWLWCLLMIVVSGKSYREDNPHYKYCDFFLKFWTATFAHSYFVLIVQLCVYKLYGIMMTLNSISYFYGNSLCQCGVIMYPHTMDLVYSFFDSRGHSSLLPSGAFRSESW